MSKMIQIRNVPDDLHATLKVRAVLANMSLSDFLLEELERLAARPTGEQMRARLEGRSRVLGGETSAHAIRSEREVR